MSTDRQMRRGKGQALYKYLPEAWIDFSVRGNERKQYIAQVDHWHSEKLARINSKRLIRTVDEAVQAFARQGAGNESGITPTTGFGAALTPDNCDVLTPYASEKERGIIAKISPLTFYCKKCYKVYQFTSEDTYRKMQRCRPCNTNLTQFRMIYFCKCGYATDRHPVRCQKHGNEFIKWDGKFNFYCAVPGCNTKIQMVSCCPICHNKLFPKNALDPSQYFPYSLSLIDLIDEKIENFISDTDYGKLISIAYWLGQLNRSELIEIINNGITTDQEKYDDIYKQNLETFIPLLGEEQAKVVAKVNADKACGSKYNECITDIRTKLQTSEHNASIAAEMLLEYDMVKNIPDYVSLDKAAEISKLLNTNANPELYGSLATKYGIATVQACDRIPFISCSYGYTRVESEYKEGVQLHAFKEEKNGRKNIYAVRLETEGILFEFDRRKIVEWLIKNNYISIDDAPNMDSDYELKMWFINHIRPDAIHPFSSINEAEAPETYYVYRLIHSLSHLLIRAAAEIGGLGKDSLSEYIFPGVPAVLIYCQNSQGFSLGSLSNTFEAYFDKWINKTLKSAGKCIFDPICLDRYKACSGCMFLNEVSCQHFNKDLDRSYVIGYYDRATKKRIYGFWEDD